MCPLSALESVCRHCGDPAECDDLCAECARDIADQHAEDAMLDDVRGAND